jgi:hypothetical protein
MLAPFSVQLPFSMSRAYRSTVALRTRRLSVFLASQASAMSGVTHSTAYSTPDRDVIRTGSGAGMRDTVALVITSPL